MFFHVYLLRSKEKMEKHNQGMVQSTKNIRPMDLIYYESYKSKEDALIREKRLKQFAKGFSSLKSRLYNSLMLEG